MPGDDRSTPANTGLLRPLALVLMVVGAAGFIAGRILFGDQVLYMLASTLVVFAGLGLILYGRKKNGLSQPQAAGKFPNVQEQTVELDQHLVSLTDFVTDSFRRQGAKVSLETRRPDRSILQISKTNGEQYTAIIHEGLDPVGISELRSLQALVSKFNSRMGFYVTDGQFTPEAAQWASGKRLSLVQKGQFDLLRLQ